MTTLYDFSGGMESAAMLVIDRQRITDVCAIVRWADTGKQFPEMADSIRQIEQVLDLRIVRVPRRITFDEFLFQRGGMVRKGTTDCSRRMKRGNLARHMNSFPRPYEVNLGFNSEEVERAEEFTDRNERPWCHWRFPLIEGSVCREMTREICRTAGFSILLAMYKKMGRFDCFFCGNQSPRQALKVADHYPDLATEWLAIEERKGHSFLPISLRVLIENRDRQALLDFGGGSKCGCFGGSECVLEDEPEEEPLYAGR